MEVGRGRVKSPCDVNAINATDRNLVIPAQAGIPFCVPGGATKIGFPPARE